MELKVLQANGKRVALVKDTAPLILDEQSALDFMMTVQYEAETNRIAVRKEAVTEDFFLLSTRLAGQVLQKFINYDVKLAIIGDFSKYDSKALRDFIYESNQGRDIFFVPSEEQAIERLSRA